MDASFGQGEVEEGFPSPSSTPKIVWSMDHHAFVLYMCSEYSIEKKKGKRKKKRGEKRRDPINLTHSHKRSRTEL
jgi:hypothetical protein